MSSTINQSEGSKTLSAGHGDGAYRYDSFTTRLMLADLRFGPGAPRPGDPFPDFDLTTLDGARLRSEDLLRRRPFVIVLGSLTCPMTAGAAGELRALHAALGGEVEFITVYTREAHPGELIPQPRELSQKIAHARQLAERDGYRWQVGVDDLDGTLHRRLDSKPNAAFVVDSSGRLAFRSLWSSDSAALRRALDAVARGDTPRRQTSHAMVRPMLRALPWIDETVGRGGRSASRDLWRAAAPMALMAKLGRLLPR